MTIPIWFVWLVVAYLTLDAISQVALIGVPREPITKGQAVWSVLWAVAFVVVLALWVTG